MDLYWKIEGASIGAITLDASVSEEHNFEADVTKSPIELKSKVSDHIQPLPESITITGIISNTPIDPTRARGDAAPRGFGPAQDAFNELTRLQSSGTLVTVVTGLQVYESMAIRSLSFPRDAKTGDSIKFTARLERVRQVKTRVVDFVIKAKTTTAQPNIPMGTQSTKPAPEAMKNSSTLNKAALATGIYKAQDYILNATQAGDTAGVIGVF